MPLVPHTRTARPFLDGRSFFALCAALIVPLLVSVIYWPARHNGFVWDDWLPLVDSPVFRDPARWWEALWSPPLDIPVAMRPLAMLTFMLQLWAGQTTPAPFHIVNVAIHAANAFLLVLVAWRVMVETTSRSTAAVSAVLCGLVYGLHPALTEAVAWISCRYDLLMTFFLLIAMLLDRSLPQAGSARAAAVGAAFLAAALSKETAVGFVLALPLMHLALGQLRGASPARAAVTAAIAAHWRVYAAVFCAGLLYLAVRTAVSGASLGMGRMAAQFDDVGAASQRVLAVAGSLGRLAVDAAWPFKAAIPSRSLMLPLGWRDALPIVPALIGGVIAAVLAARAGPVGRAHFALLIAFAAALLPVSNLFPLPGVYGELWVATRYLTFPLVFLCLAAPLAICLMERWMARHTARARRLLVLVAVVWIAASAALVRATIPLWKDDGAMNTWAIQGGARSYWRHQNLGDYYLKAGKPEQARSEFIIAVRLRGDIAKNWYYLGFTEASLGNADPARDALRSALELDPDLWRARLTLAKVELGQGRPEVAAKVLEEGSGRVARANEPGQKGTFHYLLGSAYAKLGRKDAAATHLTAALELAVDAAERRSAEAALRSIEPARK
jgi:tetratricopeptide (TPR) repeat protein